MGLSEAIQRTLANAEKLRANGSANEANTKALLIEPMLAALGWDPVDLDSVEREVRVYEGTFLDYALKIAGRPRVCVEAKAIGENLEDKKFIAQTVNYANNDGVVWCALTDGVRWRVYKTNETAPMDQNSSSRSTSAMHLRLGAKRSASFAWWVMTPCGTASSIASAIASSPTGAFGPRWR